MGVCGGVGRGWEAALGCCEGIACAVVVEVLGVRGGVTLPDDLGGDGPSLRPPPPPFV